MEGVDGRPGAQDNCGRRMEEPGSNNGAGWALFIGFRELKRGAPAGRHVVTLSQPGPIASALRSNSESPRCEEQVGVRVMPPQAQL